MLKQQGFFRVPKQMTDIADFQATASINCKVVGAEGYLVLAEWNKNPFTIDSQADGFNSALPIVTISCLTPANLIFQSSRTILVAISAYHI